MKNILKSLTRTVKRLAVVAAVAGFALIAPQIQAQVSSLNNYSLTTLPATLASNVVSATTNIIPLTRNCGLSLAGRANTSAGAGTEVLSGSFSNDGTNFGIAPFTLTFTLSTTFPTNTVSVGTNWSPAALSGFVAVNFTTLTNTGPGTATNIGWVVNRPTLSTATY